MCVYMRLSYLSAVCSIVGMSNDVFYRTDSDICKVISCHVNFRHDQGINDVRDVVVA